MKHRHLLCCLLSLLTYAASAQDHRSLIKHTAQLMADAIVAGDYNTVIAYTYPPFVKARGGKAKLEADIKQGLLKLKSAGNPLIIKHIEIGDPSKEVKIDSAWYSVVPEKIILKMNGDDYSGTGSLVAISSDNGEHWFFLDAASPQKLEAMIPEVKQLNIPLPTYPIKLNSATGNESSSSKALDDENIKGDPDPDAVMKSRLADTNKNENDNKPLPKSIYLQNAGKHIGQLVEFTANVYSHKNTANLVMLNLGSNFPANMVTVVLKGAARARTKDIDGKAALIEGIVSLWKGVPRIVVTDPDDITVLWKTD